MKRPDIYLKEYCQRLSDENLKFLQSRFSQNLSGDAEEILVYLSNVREIDKWLVSAESHDDFYDMLDLIQYSVNKEHDRRSNSKDAA